MVSDYSKITAHQQSPAQLAAAISVESDCAVSDLDCFFDRAPALGSLLN